MEGSKEKLKGGKEKKKSVRLAVGGDSESAGQSGGADGSNPSAGLTSSASVATLTGEQPVTTTTAGSSSQGATLGASSGGGASVGSSGNAGSSSAVKPQKSPLLFLSRRIGKGIKKKGGSVDIDDDTKLTAGSSSSIGTAAVGESTASQSSLTKQTTRLAAPKTRKGISKVLHDLRYRSIRQPKNSKVSKSRSAPVDVGSSNRSSVVMDNGSHRSLVSDDGDTFSSVYATPMQSEAPSSGYSTPTIFSSGVGSPTESLSESLVEEEQEQTAVKDQVVAVDSPSVSFNPFSANLPSNMSRLYCGVYIVGPTIRRVDVDPSTLPHLLDSQVTDITSTTSVVPPPYPITVATTPTELDRPTAAAPTAAESPADAATAAAANANAANAATTFTPAEIITKDDANAPLASSESSLSSTKLNDDSSLDVVVTQSSPESTAGTQRRTNSNSPPLVPKRSPTTVLVSRPATLAPSTAAPSTAAPSIAAPSIAAPSTAAPSTATSTNSIPDRSSSTGEIRFCFSEFKGLQTSPPTHEARHGLFNSLPTRTDQMDPHAVHTHTSTNIDVVLLKTQQS